MVGLDTAMIPSDYFDIVKVVVLGGLVTWALKPRPPR